MDLQLGAKVAFVSGSTTGIGLAIAGRLARESADVVINGRTEERVGEAVAQIKKDSRDANVRGIAADFGQRKRLQRGRAPVVARGYPDQQRRHFRAEVF